MDLRGCSVHFMIPIVGLKKLVNLRHFWLPKRYPRYNVYFPSGIGNLTNLQTLNLFCVAKYSISGGKNKSTFSRLRDLCHLNNLRGELSIVIEKSYPNMSLDAREANLKAKKRLETLELIFPREIIDAADNEMVLENLQPHDKLSYLAIELYQGVKFPTWMAMNQLTSSLPHLASISISQCPNVRELPSFAHLPHLVSLSLWDLQGVEYIESGDYEAYCSSSSTSVPSSSSSSSCNIFFPSLTNLCIGDLVRLKGWSRSCTRVENLSFPCVSVVDISRCPGLESMPSCPNVELLNRGKDLNQNLEILKLTAAANNSSSSWVPKLKSLTVWDVKGLASLPREYVQQVTQLKAVCFDDDSAKQEYLKAFEGFASIQSLVFDSGYGVMPISSIAHQLGSLQRMELRECKFIYSDTDDYSYDSWKLLKSLRSVVIEKLVASIGLEGLVKGLQHVTALQSLELRNCRRLKLLPDRSQDSQPWISIKP